MSLKCKDCKFWQGNKYSKWADCYRVVGQLQPDLQCCYVANEFGTIEKFFDMPFDPHDVKYWMHNEVWRKLYNEAVAFAKITDIKVRVIEETRDDVIYDQKNGERIGKLKLCYFQTHRDYECKGEDE